MKESKGVHTGVRIAMQIVFVVMAALTLLQAVAFAVMADRGVYHETLKQAKNNKVTQLTSETAHEITEAYVYHDKQIAREMVENMYDSNTMNLVIKKNGKEYARLGSSAKEEQVSASWTNDYFVVFVQQNDNAECVWMEDMEEAENFCKEFSEDADIYQVSCHTFLTKEEMTGSILGVSINMLQIGYRLRYTIIWTFFITLAVAFILLILLIKTENRKICLVDKLPFDFYLIACYGVVVIGLTVAGMSCIENIFYTTYMFYDASVIYLLAAGLVICCVAVPAATLQLFLSITRQNKNRSLWKNTITYRILCRIIGWAKRSIHFINKNVPVIWKGLLVYSGVCILHIVWLLLCYQRFCYDGEALIMATLVWYAVLVIPYSFLLIQMKKLFESGEKLAEGDFSHKTDTKKMLFDFRKHGEHLNCISVGIQNAVDERMKSEHFKTELITNVSHDIKTPLTSIINYVDLLEKEDLQNPRAAEYLEVLSRQSARLKKLIEDLIEASKASTGALAVHLEECEVGVLLTQAAGEFEEKLSAQELTLLLKKPENEFVIRADGRHLWRVFDNLLNNICKYAQPHTRVYLNLEKNGDYIEIVFRNTSRYELNMTGEELKERFVRGDSSRNTEGNGLGLSIAQSLTELMGGTFELVIDGDLFKVILKFPLING